MRGQVTVAPGKRFLRFEFDPNATVDDWKKAQALLMQLVKETGIQRVLVDVRSQKASGHFAELFNFGAGIPDGMAFAVLADPGREDYRFIETVALNRGKTVRLFPPDREAAAVRWLEAGGKPENNVA